MLTVYLNPNNIGNLKKVNFQSIKLKSQKFYSYQSSLFLIQSKKNNTNAQVCNKDRVIIYVL